MGAVTCCWPRKGGGEVRMKPQTSALWGQGGGRGPVTEDPSGLLLGWAGRARRERCRPRAPSGPTPPCFVAACRTPGSLGTRMEKTWARPRETQVRTQSPRGRAVATQRWGVGARQVQVLVSTWSPRPGPQMSPLQPSLPGPGNGATKQPRGLSHTRTPLGSPGTE